jgi:mono/diheme cytochrome c family protein
MAENNAKVRVRARELREPEERIQGLPMAYVVFAILLTFWGAYYILTETDEGYLGDQRTEAALRPAPRKTTGVDGTQIYAAKCVSCHQASGAGVAGVFPPLAGSEWVAGDANTLIRLVLLGVTGEIEVKKQKYNGQMPAFKDQLSDAEVAGVLSHIRSQWGNSAASIDASAVKAARDAVGSRADPWKGGEELKSAR